MPPTLTRRFFARLIDEAICVIMIVEIGNLFVILRGLHSLMISAGIVSAILAYIVYNVLLETGKRQATLGKQMTGLHVCNQHGGRITVIQSFARLTVRCTVSIPLLFIALLTKRQQTLHDLAAGTFVVVRG